MHTATSTRSRLAFTYVELLVVLAVLAILLSVSLRSASQWMHLAAVHSATRSAADAFATARDVAITTGARTAIRIDETQGLIAVHSEQDTSHRFALGALHRVTLEASRDSMAYSPSGLGWGASNLRLIVKRASKADTINVSRLGRVRY